MSEVHILPTPRAHIAAANANPRNAGTCGIYDIAGRLGMAQRGPNPICATLDAYVGDLGFPAPFPRVRNGKLVQGVAPGSRWPRVAVDAWFEGRLPPAARGLVDQAERVSIDSTLSARAFEIFGGDAA